MNPISRFSVVMLAALMLAGCASTPGLNAERAVYVSPGGDDGAAGSRAAPFRTLFRAQTAARELARNMSADVSVNVAAGEYRLDKPLQFTPADSGTNGFRVIYRSAEGPGKARLLGSVPLKGWQPYRDGIWKIDLPPKTVFHTLQIQGASRTQCVENLVFDGLALEETDCAPPLALWAYDGKRDGALVWLNNAAGIEIRNCHLKNSGRSGIMMIGHNTDNRVTGCWVEHTGLNGVSLCNRFIAPSGKGPTADRCERNRIHNCRINNIGELHTYAECVTLFNVCSNDVGHCELRDCVRYAVTLRGNTGEQYGPPVTTDYPPCSGNRIHHLRVSRCGQDGGDMGALHAASLNNPGGGSVNTFEQISVADTRAVASMKDWPPDGIFIDWPKMSMDQIFHDIRILRPQGKQLRSNGPENEASAQTENVSWKPGFREDQMDEANIGLTSEFPAEYGGRTATR
jgi:hypothetical protein